MDLAIIGGGVAGISAAISAAQKGLKVCLIEKDKIGGVHVNWGGIPTKALISGAEIIKRVRDARRLGVKGIVNVEWNELQKHSVMVSSQVLRFNEMSLGKMGVEIIHGEGEVFSNRGVRIWREKDERVVHAENILIATGSESVSIPSMPFGNRIINSNDALKLSEIPESILIVGGGAIGLEFATIFSIVGSKVIVVELLPRLLPNEEPDVGEFIKKRIEMEGTKVLVGSKVVNARINEKNVEVTIKTPDGITTEKVEMLLVAIGRKPNVDPKRLESLGIKTTRKGIIVNERMQTSIPNIYAAGDVVGKHLLLNVAMREGKIAAANIAGEHKVMNYSSIPRCVFTLPEVAAVGLTEEQARRENVDVIVVKDPFFSPRAAGAGESGGFIKIISSPEGIILGATIVGSHASELIFPLSMALHKGISTIELAELFYPSPAFIEVVMNAVGKVVGKAIFGIR